MAERNEKVTLGKKDFTVTHHEPSLEGSDGAEKKKGLSHQLYAVFSKMIKKDDKKGKE